MLEAKKPVPLPEFCLDVDPSPVAPRWTGDGDAFSHSSDMDLIEAFLARIIHEGSSPFDTLRVPSPVEGRKRAAAKRDGHSEA